MKKNKIDLGLSMGHLAEGTATHHRIHLEEFALREKLSINETGIETIYGSAHTSIYGRGRKRYDSCT